MFGTHLTDAAGAYWRWTVPVFSRIPFETGDLACLGELLSRDRLGTRVGGDRTPGAELTL
jgi:hypothetical protein